MGQGGFPPTLPNQTPNTIGLYLGSQAVGDKLHGREGNSPDRQLRSQMQAKWLKEVEVQ